VYFVITGLDGPDTAELRSRTRMAHRDYLYGAHDAVTLKLAGPLLSDDGTTIVGSMMVVAADDIAAAQRFAADDPYCTAGLFAQGRVRGWRWNAGNPDAP
jgi:uncharacterized protein YciI